nr:ethylene-responsive transcription factor ERF016-like [Aegilops tauschii subsp. strangulata]
MAGQHGRRSPPSIRSSDPCHILELTSPLAHISVFPDLPPPRQPQKKYLNIHYHAWGTWVAQITDRGTHTKKWIGSFHMVELAALEYNWWQVQFDGAAAKVSFPLGMASVHLLPVALGVVDAMTIQELHREARGVIAAEAADEEYMAELHRQHPELVKADRAVKGEVVAISHDEEQGGGGGNGSTEDEFDAEKWRHIFLDSGEDGTGPDPMDGGMLRQDWLDLYYGKDEKEY